MFGGFGQQQQQPGQQATPASTFGGFGATPASTTTGFGAGAFGQPSQQPAATAGTTGFGGFGAAPTTTAGFGTTTSGFGGGFGSAAQQPAAAQPTTTPGFGGFGGATTTGGFGAPATGGFGAAPTTTGGFGQPAAASGGFGQPAATTTTGFGGFGGASSAAQPTASTGFGGGFGAAAAPATGGFGSATTGGFGAGASSAQQPTSLTVNNGTGNPSYTVTTEKDPGTYTTQSYHNISMMPAYKNWSAEELRVRDYELGKKFAGAQPTAAGFGSGVGATSTTGLGGGFGQPTTTTGGFGGGGFGQPAAASGGMFGQPAQTTTTTGLGGFGTGTTGGFGSAAPATTTTTGFGGFGQQQQPAAQTSAFGGFGAAAQPATTTTGGFGGFGQQQPAATTGATSAFGGFGAAKPGGLFGSTTPATGGFGQPAAGTTTTGGFGQPATTGLFGAGGTSTTSAFGQPAAAKPAFGGFGAAPASTTTTATSGFGGFGQPAAGSTAPTTSFGFGQQQQQQQQQPTTTSGFGAPATTTTPAGGMFGQQAPGATTTTGFSFGKPATTTTAAAPTTGFSFGAAPSTTATATPTLGGGMFGQPQQQPQQQQQGFGLPGASTTAASSSGGLFGGLGGLGATSTAAKPAFSFSLGGGTTGAAAQPATSAPTLGGGMFSGFGASTSQQQQQQQAQQQQQPSLTASIDANAYGTNPLLQPKALPSDKKDESFRASRTIPGATPSGAGADKMSASTLGSVKKPVVMPQYRFFPTPQRDVRMKPKATGVPAGPSAARLAESMHVPDKVIYSTEQFQTKRSVKKLEITEKEREVRAGLTVTSSPMDARRKSAGEEQQPPPTSERKKVTWDFKLGATGPASAGASAADTTLPLGDTTFESPMPVKKLDFHASPEPALYPRPSMAPVESPKVIRPSVDRSFSDVDGDAAATVSLADVPSDYYTVPSLKELMRRSSADLKHVEAFEVGRKGFGSVRWLQPVDLSLFLRMGGLATIPGHVVRFTKKMCSVYDGVEEENKHEQGVGLNRPAEIHLVGCWPMDRTTKQPVTSSASPRLKHFMSKLRTVPETMFVGYEPATGEWRFRVEHFSRYGLGEDFDDYEEPTPSASTPAVVSKQAPGEMDMSEREDSFALENEGGAVNVDADTGMSTARGAIQHAALDGRRLHHMRRSLFPATTTGKSGTASTQDGGIQIKARAVPLSEDFAFDEMLSPAQPVKLGAVARYPIDNLRHLDATVAEQQFEKAPARLIREPVVAKVSPSKDIDALLLSPQTIAMDVVTPKTKLYAVPLANSITHNRERNARDPSLMLARSFRSSWAWISTADGGQKMVCVRLASAGGKQIVKLESVNIGTLPAQGRADSAIYESCLEIQLDHAVIRPGLKVPNLKPIPFGALCDNVKYPNAMDKSGSAMAQLTTFEKQLWKLGWSLFDALPAVDADASFEIDKDDKESEYVTEQKRKDRLSHWLKNTVQPVAKQEIDQITSKATDRDTLPAKVIFALLSCRNIGEAHAVALKSRSFFLATIIAQLSDNSGANCDFSGSGGLDDQSREDLYNQVRLWTAEKGMKGIPLVPQDVVRIYRLLCSDMDAIHEDLKLSGTELDWKRTFGLYFWYWATANNKIVDALDAYDLAIDATTAKSGIRAPQPWYTELSRANDKTDRRSAPRDLLYHLLKIYTNPEHPLEMAIQPVNFYPPPESAVRQFKLGPIASHRMLWHLWSVLKSQNIRTFRDDGGAIDVSLDRSADFGIDGRAEDASFAIMDVDSNAMALDRGSEDDSPSSDSWHGAYLTMAYVMELEHAGLWHWAVFVALHFCNRASRTRVIDDILARHVRYERDGKHLAHLNWSFSKGVLPDYGRQKKFARRPHDSPAAVSVIPAASADYATREAFLLDRIAIPAESVFRAKALLARSQRDMLGEAAFLLRAGHHDLAHGVVLRDLLPSAFVGRHMDVVRALVAPFNERNVPDWPRGAGLFRDFLAVRDRVSELKMAVTAAARDASAVESCGKDVLDLLKRLGGLESKRKRGDLDVRLLFENIQFRVSIAEMSNDLGSMLTALHQLAPVASVREASARRQREAPIVESAPMTSSARLALVHAMVGEFFAGGEVVAAQ